MTILIHVDPEDPSFADENRFLIKYILSVINTFWNKEKVPPILKQSILIPIIKKIDCDTTNPTNYRPISLLNTLMKLYEGLIKKHDWLTSWKLCGCYCQFKQHTEKEGLLVTIY